MDAELAVLHQLRIKGVAGPERVAAALGWKRSAAQDTLDRLAAERDVTGGASGWALTPAGHERHARGLGAGATPEARASVQIGYLAFLELNGPLKAAMSSWQTGGGDVALLIEELEELDEEVQEALGRAGEGAARFARYGERLGEALERARDGDVRYVADPLRDSFHTVWFECHEDFLVTLGRTRADEADLG